VLYFGLKMRCACHFILNEAVRNSALALHRSPKSPTRAGPGPRAPPPRGPRESWSRGRGVVASGKLQELSL
jgi:hypothetical protein